MAQKRELFRVAIDRTGLTDGAFHAGEVFHLEFALNETSSVMCTVQVTHVRAPYLGAVITTISSDYQTQLSRFIEQVNSLNMTGF